MVTGKLRSRRLAVPSCRYASAVLDPDHEIRSLAFAYVAEKTRGGAEPISWKDLTSFEFAGQRVPLVSPRGITKPAVMSLPISILTTYTPPGQPRPYEDEEDEDGFLLYRYQGTDPNSHDNRWLREIHRRGLPLLYLYGVATGLYLASTAIVVEDHSADLTFLIELLPVVAAIDMPVGALQLDSQARRHNLALVKRRVGQERFRQAVLTAYRHQCSLCRIRHTPLLDAAHIIPFAQGGSLEVRNGLSMCKIHHAAYDYNILGVNPDYRVEVKAEILEEVDGPMLRHGLQELHGAKLILPRRPANHPDREALARRYEQFQKAG